MSYYVDEEYYIMKYHGEEVDELEFDKLCKMAEELIEEMTLYRLTPVAFLAMPEDVRERVRQAVCVQIDYLDANGGAEMDNSTGIQSATLGKFSYSGSTGTNGSTEQSRFSPRAERLLWPTGLTYRGGRY